MKLPPATERIKKLRETYMESPMMKQKLSYGMDLRQRVLFRRGWSLHCDVEDNILRRSLAHAYVLENMKPVINEGELIIGQPDFTPLTPEEKIELAIPCEMPDCPGRESHMALDFEKLVRLGVRGLIDEIKTHENWQDNYFYCGAVVELNALLTLAEHYANYAEQLGYVEIATILRKVPAGPASNFREALQSIHFYGFTLWGLYQAGHPDRYLLSYYLSDVESGLETPDSAQELIDCFCLLYSTYIVSNSSIGFMIGGTDRDGNAVENELTWLFLNSIGHTRTADPSIGLCVTDDTSKELLLTAAGFIADGCTHPAFYNDKCIIDSLIAYGYNPVDAREYIHSCCVEITASGKSAVWTVSPYHNVLQIMLDAICIHINAVSFEELFNGFTELLDKRIKEGNDNENRWQETRYRNGSEPLRVSCLVDDCIKRSKCINRGGAIYNAIQPNFLGLSNTVDSFMAIKELVFSQKRFTLAQLQLILDDNYINHEDIRKYINNKLSHYGNDEPECDLLMSRIADTICKSCGKLTTFRNDKVIPAAFSYNEHIRFGRTTEASPDGRLAGEPLNDGTNPVQGHDIKGPIAMLNSSSRWNQSRFMGGIATNLELTVTQAKPDIITALIRGFFESGGVEIQINVVNAGELIDAKINPDKHRNLVVRIGGYSDYFTSLPEALQNEVISRNRF